MKRSWYPKNEKITDEKKIEELINDYNIYVDKWNERELDRDSDLGDFSMFELSESGGRGRVITFYYKNKQNDYRIHTFNDRGNVRVFKYYNVYDIRYRAKFNQFYDGLSCCKHKIKRGDILSVTLRCYSNGGEEIKN